MRRALALAVVLAVVGSAGMAAARDRVAPAPTSALAKRYPNAVVLRPPPSGRHAIPAASVRVSPTAILAGDTSQRIEVTFTLRRAVRSSSFSVRLPERWLHPRGRTPYVRAGRGVARSMFAMSPPARA